MFNKFLVKELDLNNLEKNGIAKNVEKNSTVIGNPAINIEKHNENKS